MRSLPAVRGPVAALAVGLLLSACSGTEPGGVASSAPAGPVPTSAVPTSAVPTAAPSASGEPSPTLFGAAYKVTQAESEGDALARTEQVLGRLEVVRVFFDGPPSWPGKAPGRNVVVSFKLEPAAVVAGQFDEQMRTWFREAPRDVDVHWVYWHEPEDDIEQGRFTAEQYRAAFAHLADLARGVEGPRTHSALVLQSYTTRPASGRDWHDYYPGDGAVDVFAWDVYNRPARRGGYTPPAELVGAQVEAARSVGKPFAVAELGSVLADGDDGSGRAQWLREVGDYLKAQDAVFVTYFDLAFNGGRDDYRLRDPASVQAWRDVSGA